MQLFRQWKKCFNQGPFKSPYSAFCPDGRLDVCSVERAKSRNEHYQTRKLQDHNQKQFCHCRGMIYDRINKADKERQSTEKEVYCIFEWNKAQQKENDRKGRICCKTIDLILFVLQHWQNPWLPHLLSFCHVIVISFPAVSKDPGTFQLSLIWQMSNNFAFNLRPAGAKYARQQTDAAVISEMVDCWWFWNWILTHPNSLSSLECQNRVELELHFFPLFESCLFWKVNKAQETLNPWQQNLTGREMFLQCALRLLIIRTVAMLTQSKNI